MYFKIIFILFLSALFFIRPSYGQDALVIKNIKTGRSFLFKKYGKITYTTFKNEDCVSGRLTSINDSSISVNGNKILFKEIYSIQRRNLLHKAARIAGIPIILTGCIITGKGIAQSLSKSKEYSEEAILIGTAYLVVGFLPYFINLREFVIDEKRGWKMEYQSGRASAKK